MFHNFTHFSSFPFTAHHIVGQMLHHPYLFLIIFHSLLFLSLFLLLFSISFFSPLTSNSCSLISCAYLPILAFLSLSSSLSFFYCLAVSSFFSILLPQVDLIAYSFHLSLHLTSSFSDDLKTVELACVLEKSFTVLHHRSYSKYISSKQISILWTVLAIF